VLGSLVDSRPAVDVTTLLPLPPSLLTPCAILIGQMVSNRFGWSVVYVVWFPQLLRFQSAELKLYGVSVETAK
jgi:hypothetical protein